MLYIYWSYALALLFYLLLIVGMLRGDRSLGDYFALREKEQLIEKTVVALEGDIHTLQEEIYRIENSKEYASKVLRDKYHILLENEELIFFDSD